MTGDLDFEKGGVQHGLYYPPLRPIEKAVLKSEPCKSTYFLYEPGNATRYEVVFSQYAHGEIVMTIANMKKSMIVPGPMHTASQIGYMKEKLGLGEGDCYALMPLINHYLEMSW